MNRFRWLLRRELWESRVVWMAPAVCGLIIIASLLLVAVGIGSMQIDGTDLEGLQQKLPAGEIASAAGVALGIVALPFFMLMLFTQFFYALDSLYAERRDRSILFWKSLPVSDTEVVLSKAATALVVMPLAAVAAALVTQVVAFLILGAKLATLPGLQDLPLHLWQPSTWAGSIAVMTFVVAASALWFLPLVGWLLLVSAWAPRSPFMWATLPPLAVALVEWILLRTHYVLATIGPRVGNLGFLARAMGGPHGVGFGVMVNEQGAHVSHTPYAMMQASGFLASPDVWIGAVVGAGLLAAAIWMRRHRDASN